MPAHVHSPYRLRRTNPVCGIPSWGLSKAWLACQLIVPLVPGCSICTLPWHSALFTQMRLNVATMALAVVPCLIGVHVKCQLNYASGRTFPHFYFIFYSSVGCRSHTWVQHAVSNDVDMQILDIIASCPGAVAALVHLLSVPACSGSEAALGMLNAFAQHVPDAAEEAVAAGALIPVWHINDYGHMIERGAIVRGYYTSAFYHHLWSITYGLSATISSCTSHSSCCGIMARMAGALITFVSRKRCTDTLTGYCASV